MCGHPGPWCFTWLFFILSSSSSSSPPWAVSSKALCSREFSPCQALTSCRDKGRGRERAGAPQQTPPPGDRPSAGAATASPKSPSIRAEVAPPGPSPPGEHAANIPAGAKAKRAPERGRQRGRRPQEAERSPSARERSAWGCGAQVPSRAPLCSARALAAIAFLRLYWKVEEVASANRGNWVKFQLGLSLPSSSVVAVLATSIQQPLAYVCSVPTGLLRTPALRSLSSLSSGVRPVPSSGVRTLRPEALLERDHPHTTTAALIAAPRCSSRAGSGDAGGGVHVHGCARVCERVCMCTAQGGSERQRFREHVPTELIAAASGSYKYCISRPKIGIHTCCSASKRATRQGKAGSGEHCL